jgi:phage replication-related protein YjqB (UPF0714/DUF867 family)
VSEDMYRNFEELKAAEPAGAWRVVHEPRGSAVVVVAPHAGGIERGTSEVALAIAHDDLSFYLFEGLKAEANSDLHITSDRFDEPTGVELVQNTTTVVAVHGAAGQAQVVYVGGLNDSFGAKVRQKLEAAGFDVQDHARMQGRAPSNICNRGKSGKGVQLELTMALRKSFFKNMTKAGRQERTPRFVAFVNAVRAALGLAAV